MKNKLNEKNCITQNAHHNSQGITLVALVITIILLLILAGVAINMAVDSDGLFAKANEAADEWNTKVGEEENAINDLLGKLETMGTEEEGVIEKPNDEDIIATYNAGDNIKLYVVPADKYLADNTKVASIQTSDVAKIATEVSEEYMFLFIGTGDMWERRSWRSETDSYYDYGVGYDYPCDYAKISYGVTSIPTGTFQGFRLKSIVIPASVTEIRSDCFDGCSNLTSVALPSGLKTIRSFAFSGCTDLTSITIPSSVETMETAVFLDCTGTVFLQGRTVVPSDWPIDWKGGKTIKLDTVDDNAQ